MKRIEEVLAETRPCQLCGIGQTVPITDAEKRPVYVRLQALNKEQALAGSVLLGGAGFTVRCKVCTNCGNVLFFYDQEATHPPKQQS